MTTDHQYNHLSESDAAQKRSVANERSAKWFAAMIVLILAGMATVAVWNTTLAAGICMLVMWSGAFICLLKGIGYKAEANLLEELDAEGYTEAAKLVSQSTTAKSALRDWLVQGTFLTENDLLQLRHLAARDVLRDIKDAVASAITAAQA